MKTLNKQVISRTEFYAAVLSLNTIIITIEYKISSETLLQ